MQENMKKTGMIDGYEIYEFKPTLFNMFGKYYPEPIKLRRIIRFFLALIDGYKVYYLTYEGKAIAYCVFQNGGSRRFDFSDTEDIIVGPVLVLEKYRGKRLASKLIETILVIKKETYKNAYCYIKKENMASINSFKKTNFIYYSEAKVTRFVCDVKKSVATDCKHIIMKYTGGTK